MALHALFRPGVGKTSTSWKRPLKASCLTSQASAVLERCSSPALARALGLARLSGGVLRVVAAEHRSQWRNRQLALERLAELLRNGLKPPPKHAAPLNPPRLSASPLGCQETARSAQAAASTPLPQRRLRSVSTTAADPCVSDFAAYSLPKNVRNCLWSERWRSKTCTSIHLASVWAAGLCRLRCRC